VFCAARALDSIASEAWKASGRPDMLARMHSVSLALTIVCVGALVPFGLVGVTIGMSLAAIGVAVYAVRGMAHALGIALVDLVHEIWPPAVAAVAMAGGLFCVEHFAVHADSHGTIVGLCLLAVEALLGLAAYLSILAILAPQPARELARALRGLTRRLGSRGGPEPRGAL
jgi:hypothetical protein